jgi:hypothetical protein
MGMTGSVQRLWGAAGLDAMKRQFDPPERRVLFEEIALPGAWYAEELTARFRRIVWTDLAGHNETTFAGFVDRSVDHGWGRIHSVLVRLATPRTLAHRAQELWRQDHSHGNVEVEMDDTTARLRLFNHPYLRDPVMRRFQAEAFRYIFSLTRVRDLRTVIGSDPEGALVMTATWR